jgi:glycosyltransferase involved in cell wall biosynthesis
MSKVLLVISSKSNTMIQLDAMIAQFEQEGYHVHLFEDQGDLEMTSLINLIQYINEYENTEIERFVFMSDIKEFVFAWFRCYNHLIDDFIYCINEGQQSSIWSISSAYTDFFKRLASFDGASQETLIGKIFINIHTDNYTYISEFLLLNNRFQYFNDFNNFNFISKTSKQEIKKNYQFRLKNYSFAEESNDKGLAFENISFSGQKVELLLSNSTSLFNDNPFFIPFGCMTLVHLKTISNSEIKFHISSILNAATELPLLAQTWIFEAIVRLIQLNPLDDEMALLFYYNFTYFKLNVNTNEMALHEIHKTSLHGQYLFPILMSMMASLKEEEAKIYIQLYDDYQKVIRKIVASFRNDVRSKNALYIPSTKKIAFLIGQMLTLLHSPTSVILNYARNLKKYYPDYEIQIFVSDAFVYPPSELIYNRYFRSEPSGKCKDTGITIHYSNHQLSRAERLKQELDLIHSFGPEIIFDLDGYNLVKEFIFEDYPILEFSMNGISRSEKSDIYISGRDAEDVYDQYRIHGLSRRKYYKHTIGVDFLEKARTVLRDDYHLTEDHYLMITVGNRLLPEVDEPFIDLIASFIADKPNARWMIVGLTELPILSHKYPEIVEKNVIFIKLEKDLAALYQVCDVYLNPFRTGGGFSAGMAMKQSLPVVALAEKSDVQVYIGVENCVQNLTEYSSELNRLYADPDYSRTKGSIMKKRIEEVFSFKPAIDEIIHFFDLTKIEFLKRKQLN